MSVDPTTIVSMIEQCVKIYEYIEAVKESSEERRRFMQEVAALRDVLVNLQGLLRDEAFTQDRSSMAPLELLFDPTRPFVELMETDLGELEEKLRGGMKNNGTGWRSLLTKMVAAGIWPLAKAESDALFTRLERHKSLVSLALQHDVDQLIREVLDIAADNKGKLSEITKAVAELMKVIGVTISYEERRKVAEWISNVSFSAYHAENSRKWLKGTGRWVLERPEFQTWASRTSWSPTLWCYGDAGVGKSVAAAMIVEHLRSIPGNVVLIIVCRYNQNREYFGEIHTFMCGLLRQLLQLEAASNVPPYLLDLYRKDIHPSEDGVRTLLIEAARIIARPIFIVLDALDECRLGFDLVTAIQHLGHDFNLLITSRRVFSQIEKYPSLRIRAADRDILALIDDKIPALPYIREDKDLQIAVRSEVVAKAKGMFLLASLKLWELEHDVTSKADVRKVLASIPASLDDAYHQIFERIGKQGARKKKLALDTIMFTYTVNGKLKREVFSGDPLMYGQLRVLLACEISMSEPEFQADRMPPLLDIMNACGGLLSTFLFQAAGPGRIFSANKREDYPDGRSSVGPCASSTCIPTYLGASTVLSFIHYSVFEYISRFQSSVFSEDPYEVTFNICTIALHHEEHLGNYPGRYHGRLQILWWEQAYYMDQRQPALVQSALANLTNVDERWAARDYWRGDPGVILRCAEWFIDSGWPEWLTTLVGKYDNDMNSLDYAALFGFCSTFRLARDRIVDEHHFRRAMEILAICHHWDLVHEIWARGEYDLNASWGGHDSTVLCRLMSDVDPRCRVDIRQSVLQHPGTTLRCPRHDGLLGCVLHHLDKHWRDVHWTIVEQFNRAVENITMILERLYRDAKDGPSQSGRISVYPPPSRTRSRPADIFDVIAVFLQRADIDLDADITQMASPEILLALLMIPWHYEAVYIDVEEVKHLLRPYARRPVDVPDTSTSNHVPDADALADHVVPDTAQAVEAMDTCPTTGPGPADSTPAHVPSGEVLDDHVVPDAARALEAVGMYRMTVVLLLVGAVISFFIYL
ncbi:hypothetical protein BDZ89DRAFT_598028 [Hymenopellis radicata]|nr:hypothetical protein BDZ89DRAFT_598028 [Hymenopellis radicata]